MKKTQSKDMALPLANAIIKGIQEKKGQEIVCLDLRKINRTICDYFIICHGDSQRQVGAIYDSIVETAFKKINEKPWHSEGKQNSEWVLLDFVNVVAHVFLKDTRSFYNLESLWADAEVIRISETGSLRQAAEKESPKKKAEPDKKSSLKRTNKNIAAKNAAKATSKKSADKKSAKKVRK